MFSPREKKKNRYIYTIKRGEEIFSKPVGLKVRARNLEKIEPTCVGGYTQRACLYRLTPLAVRNREKERFPVIPPISMIFVAHDFVPSRVS